MHQKPCWHSDAHYPHWASPSRRFFFATNAPLATDSADLAFDFVCFFAAAAPLATSADDFFSFFLARPLATVVPAGRPRLFGGSAGGASLAASAAALRAACALARLLNSAVLAKRFPVCAPVPRMLKNVSADAEALLAIGSVGAVGAMVPVCPAPKLKKGPVGGAGEELQGGLPGALEDSSSSMRMGIVAAGQIADLHTVWR